MSDDEKRYETAYDSLASYFSKDSDAERQITAMDALRQYAITTNGTGMNILGGQQANRAMRPGPTVDERKLMYKNVLDKMLDEKHMRVEGQINKHSNAANGLKMVLRWCPTGDPAARDAPFTSAAVETGKYSVQFVVDGLSVAVRGIYHSTSEDIVDSTIYKGMEPTVFFSSVMMERSTLSSAKISEINAMQDIFRAIAQEL